MQKTDSPLFGDLEAARKRLRGLAALAALHMGDVESINAIALTIIVHLNGPLCGTRWSELNDRFRRDLEAERASDWTLGIKRDDWVSGLQ